MIFKFLAGMAVGVDAGSRFVGSKVCLDNFLNTPIYWGVATDTLAKCSAPVGPVASGTTSCEDLNNIIIGGAIKGGDYNIFSWFGATDPASVPDTQQYWAQPFLQYDSNGPTQKYVCGMATVFPRSVLGYCCCIPGQSVDVNSICMWNGEAQYSEECLDPPGIMPAQPAAF